MSCFLKSDTNEIDFLAKEVWRNFDAARGCAVVENYRGIAEFRIEIAEL